MYVKAIIAVYDDENKMKKELNKLVRDDIDNEILRLKHCILDEVNKTKRQELGVNMNTLELQKIPINEFKSNYYLNNETITRYYVYMKELNKIVPTFIY